MKMNFSAKTARRVEQGFFVAVCLYAGWGFARFLEWTTHPDAAFTPKPGTVEGFLPIAALAGLKNLFLTGTYDFVHPAGLTILLSAMACALIFRKSFCGAVCPVGLVSDLLGEAGKRAGLGRRASKLLDRTAGAIKYLLLGFFLISIFALMDGASTRQFLSSDYNMTADASLFRLFAHPSRTFLTVLVVLGVMGAVFRNAWCRWLCPYGALLGLLGMAGPCSVRRDSNSCDGCGRCARACPMDIAPGGAARSSRCMACGQCVEACPKPGTLTMRFLAGPVRPWVPLLCGVGLFLGGCGLAMALGAWDCTLPMNMLRTLYAQAAP
jgi:NAD-dependent dihydropyrimidine dehydrogenase PreA subunit